MATYLAYQPGLFGTFVFDDYPNIIQNQYLAIQDFKIATLQHAASSGQSGPAGRPISMLSFAINHYFTGFNPYYFKITNLIIHGFNGVGIFFLTSLILGVYRKRYQDALTPGHIQWMSLALAAAWLLHPFNVTSVLYVVQRMTSLAACFSIWGLALYLWGRSRLLEENKGIIAILASILLFTPLAALSKENGALLPLLMLIAEITLLDFETKTPLAKRFLVVVFICTVAIPAVLAFFYLAVPINRLLSGYVNREFSLIERVMTEGRVLWFYIRMIIIPDVSQMGLFHDDLNISKNLLTPITTLPSLVGIAILVITAFIVRKRAPLISFGLLFFFAGHILESTVLALEIAHEHRNYFPMYGLLLIFFYYLMYPLRYQQYLRIRQGTAILLILLFTAGTFSRATKWSNPFDFAESEVAHHPDSPRDNGEMAIAYAGIRSNSPEAMEMNYLAARYHFEKATQLNVNYTNGLFGLIIMSAQRGKPVDHGWIRELQDRLEKSVLAANNNDGLIRLVTCQFDGICKLTEKEIEGLLYAQLRNPRLVGEQKALALSSLSYYLVNVKRDYPGALAVMYQTVGSAPQEPEHRLTLIKFLIAIKKTEEAKQQLAQLKQLKKTQLVQNEILLLDARLAR
jgi:hypothetical protein